MRSPIVRCSHAAIPSPVSWRGRSLRATGGRGKVIALGERPGLLVGDEHEPRGGLVVVLVGCPLAGRDGGSLGEGDSLELVAADLVGVDCGVHRPHDDHPGVLAAYRAAVRDGHVEERPHFLRCLGGGHLG